MVVGDEGGASGGIGSDVLMLGPNASADQMWDGSVVTVAASGKLDLATNDKSEQIGLLVLETGRTASAP